MLMPVHTSYERKFFNDFKNSVNQFISGNPNCEYYDVVRKFGMPKDIIDAYYSSISTQQLYRKRKIAIISSVLIAITLLLCIFYCVNYYNEFMAA